MAIRSTSIDTHGKLSCGTSSRRDSAWRTFRSGAPTRRRSSPFWGSRRWAPFRGRRRRSTAPLQNSPILLRVLLPPQAAVLWNQSSLSRDSTSAPASSHASRRGAPVPTTAANGLREESTHCSGMCGTPDLEFKMDTLSKVVGELGVRERRQRGRLCEV